MNLISEDVLDLMIYDRREHSSFNDYDCIKNCRDFIHSNNKPEAYFSTTFLLDFVRQSQKLYILINCLFKQLHCL